MLSVCYLILFLIIRILSNSFANFYQKKLAGFNSSLTINFYSFLILSIFVLPFAPNFFVQGYGIYFWFVVFLSGFLCTLGTLCLIKAMQIGELSVIAPINSYKSVVGLLASLFLLKEIPSFLGILGIVLIIFGSRYIFASTQEGFSFKLLKRKDIQLRLLALLLTGIEAAILKKIIILSSVEMCFVMWCFTGLFWSLIFVLISKKSFKVSNNNVFVQILFIAILLSIMQYSTNYVFERMNVGYALALFQLSSLVTVLLGYKIFNEKDILNKIFGSIVMIVGSILIILH